MSRAYPNFSTRRLVAAIAACAILVVSGLAEATDYHSASVGAPRGAVAELTRATDIKHDSRKGTVRLLRNPVAVGDMRNGSTTGSARAFLRHNKELLGLENPDSELMAISDKADGLGGRRVRYAQQHQGLPVWPSQLNVHLDAAGRVKLMEGAYVKTPALATVPTLNAGQAADAAHAFVPKDAGHVEKTELIVYAPTEGDDIRLAWRVVFHGAAHQDWLAVVDAHTGEKLTAYNQVCTTHVQGSGIDLFGNQRDIAVWYEEPEDLFYLIDTTKSSFNTATGDGLIRILDAENQAPNASGNISLLAVTSESPDANWLPDAVSAAFGLSTTYDYFSTAFGRNSLDGNGGTITAVVRFDTDFQNAFWSDNLQTMFFGDAAPYAGALDVVAHELTHGVTSSESNLVYQFQPGALNEAMSDIFGEVVEAFAFGDCDWKKGTDLGIVIQDYADPNSVSQLGLPNPANMSQFRDLPIGTDNGGVHINSSIINHCFYLLAEGMSGAIGMDDASAIFYRANTVHLVESSQFIDARFACIQSAEELFGAGSTQQQKTAEAFDAVEIFDENAAPTPTPGIDDGFEENDTQNAARQITPGTHLLEGNDDDWFFFDVSGPAEVSISITGPQGDLDLCVLTEQGTFIACTDAIGTNDTIEGNEVEAVRRLLLVTPFQNQTGSYTLTLSIDEETATPDPLPPVEPQDDTFEDNDDPETAALLAPGTYELNGLDTDWFMVDVEEGGAIQVSISGPEGDLDMCMYDPDGSLVSCSEDAGSNESIEATDADGGPHYILVSPFRDDLTSTYTMMISVDAPPPPPEVDECPGTDACGNCVPVAGAMLAGMIGLGTGARRRSRRTR